MMNKRNVGICGAMQVLRRYVTHRYIRPPEIAQESRTKSIQQHLSFHGGVGRRRSRAGRSLLPCGATSFCFAPGTKKPRQLWICSSRAIECLPGPSVLYSKVAFAIMCTVFYKGMHNSLNMRARVPSKEAINF
ncbi:hypothetical protein GYMLUDRAFT_51413 [Collybiopsis luxurians FD-317 M1]|uniref:Uncharacterized protein n=1 Tax=Collybiopsis luxurians FD-317 M1 TaxID=944289 RepID=A0A0D0C5R1_9AGAR|nr:hypothetical protein GYMLUDRAFT_51413 [Collybiopsis luxurians FD-317 M1]